MGKGRLNLYEAVRTAGRCDTADRHHDHADQWRRCLRDRARLWRPPLTTSLWQASSSCWMTTRSAPKMTAAPYELTWNDGGDANGSHVLTAIARDAAGNQSSSIVSVTVSNDTAAPTVALTSPAAGATVGGTVTVSGDRVGRSGSLRRPVQAGWRRRSAAEDTVAPYEVTWTTDRGEWRAHADGSRARRGGPRDDGGECQRDGRERHGGRPWR